jgi:hypothetical protein
MEARAVMNAATAIIRPHASAYSAIALETPGSAIAALTARGLTADVTQMSARPHHILAWPNATGHGQ